MSEEKNRPEGATEAGAPEAGASEASAPEAGALPKPARWLTWSAPESFRRTWQARLWASSGWPATRIP